MVNGTARLGLCHEDSVSVHVASAEAAEGRVPSDARGRRGGRARAPGCSPDGRRGSCCLQLARAVLKGSLSSGAEPSLAPF